MIFGASCLADVELGAVIVDPGTITDPRASGPFTLEINGVDWRAWFAVDSLQIDDTLGQPVSCTFQIINPVTPPNVGDRIRVLYYSAILFAGLLTRKSINPDTSLSAILHDCTCTDWSIILSRHRLQRNFTNSPIANIVDSLLANELVGEGLTRGTIDQGTTLPLVDVRNARAFDVFRDMAGATGQSMFVDFLKVIQFQSTTNTTAPKVLDYTTVEASSFVEDLERYRNVQTVICTGTPASGQDAAVSTSIKINADQIAARAALEGGTGRYEDIEEVTHPTSNLGADVALMAVGYARLRLSTSGVPSKTLRARVRGYDFRAGQFISVNLPVHGASGTWLIQRCQFREEAAQGLVYDLEVTQSSSQLRAYEAWLNIVKAGKVVVQIPGSLTNNLATFNTPGSTTWTVPAGVTSAEFTCLGGSASAGGRWRITNLHGSLSVSRWTCDYAATGGKGGNSGKAITQKDVVEGQVFDLVIGAAGFGGGATGSIALPLSVCPNATATDGVDGALSSVKLGAVTVCQGDNGGKGLKASGSVDAGTNGANGADGSGIGDAVTVGGGKVGGMNNPPDNGKDGLIEIRW